MSPTPSRSLLLQPALFLLVVCLAAAAPTYGQTPDPMLAPLFLDHAVLQRDAPIKVWGTQAPGTMVTVHLAGASTTAKTDEAGQWRAQLPPMPAGGPHALTVRTATEVETAEDILIGDVFLCSGQSNMELQVNRALNAPSEIGNSANDRIRMVKVERDASPAPLSAFRQPVAWEAASPATVADWSAVCYFFARELQRHVDVPIGLINSSWGGTDIRAWMNADALAAVGGYEDALTLLKLYAKDADAAQQAFGEAWQAWWRGRTGDAVDASPWQPSSGAGWPLAPEALGDWKGWDVAELAGHNGMLWHRTTVTLTAEQASQDALLALGGIDEVDQTWINGRVVGNTFGWGTERTYHVPAEWLQEGENVIVVNVLNTWGTGGLIGDPARRALFVDGDEDGERVAFGTWRYQKVPPSVGMPPRTPWEAVGGRTTIHNAMVAPIGPYGLAGALWYQGESNTGEPQTYRALLRGLIAQWRAQFGADLPVFVAQLANYGRPPVAPGTSGWAAVREAQRLAVRDDPRAALAVTIDLGDVYDIHPANKQEVGRRLARAARHVLYGEAITPSGPAVAEAVRLGDVIAVHFEDVDGQLVARGHTRPIGFEVCGAEQASCRYVDASIEGDAVHLPAGADATRVRYCWADSPVCTLYDTSGLPAGPFEVSISSE